MTLFDWIHLHLFDYYNNLKLLRIVARTFKIKGQFAKERTIRTIFKIPSKVISLILWKPYRKNQGRQEQGKNEEQESIHCQITGDSSQRMSADIARKRQFYTEPLI